MATKPTKERAAKDEDTIVNVIWSELSRTVDFGNQALTENRRKSWNYFFNRARGDEVEGRSTVQSTDVRDVIHALMASIMPSYATDHPITLEPFGPDDIDQAAAESAAVNNLFTETAQGYVELSSAVHSALLHRNGIIKVWVEDVTDTTHRAFAAPKAEVLAGAPEGEKWEWIEEDDDGINHFTVTAKRQKLRIESIEPAYFYTDPNQRDQNLQESTFTAELTYPSRSDLLELGVSLEKVESLPATPDKGTPTGGTTSNTDILAKFVEGHSEITDGSTWERETIECYWIHMLIDTTGDGLVEKWRYLVSNRRMLLDDPVTHFPYSSGTGWPVPHRWSGLSVYDLERITQDEKTNARRQLADNLNMANNQRPVFDPGETEAEDIAAGAPGRGIRSRNPGNVTFMPVGDIVSNSIQFLQYMDGVRGEQTGAALDLASAEASLMKEASGISVEMQLQPREQIAAWVSKNLAETLVRNTFLTIHTVLRVDWRSPIMYQKSGDWQQTLPSEWQPRTRININVGLSAGERRRQGSALQFVLQMQLQMIQGGTANITTTWKGVHSALASWMKSQELDGAEGYFLDPAGQESLQGQQNAAQSQQQAQQQEQQLQGFQLQMAQMETKMEQAKVKLDKYEHDTQLAHDYWAKLFEADNEDMRLEQQGQEGAGEGRQGTAGATGTNGAGGRAAS